MAGLVLVASYLLGAIPFGYLVARARGVNIFEQGSGNLGATNVARVLGFRFGLLVFALDFAKGAIPVALALHFKPDYDDELWRRGWVEVGAGLLAFLGHLFPIYLRFRGGKGVATGAGVVAVLLPLPALIALAVWVATLLAWRYVSLSSIAAAVALAAAYLATQPSFDIAEPRTLFALLAAALVTLKHRSNLQRVWQGQEYQLKDRPLMNQLGKSLHVLSLGMWFGMAVFFTFVVALSLFNSFETAAQKEPRESWFPQPEMYRAAKEGIDPAKEQGSRAAGYAVAPLFTWYFVIQGVCGFLALATALPWAKAGGAHRWRVSLLMVAVLLVLVGWPVERLVHDLHVPRNQTMERYLDGKATLEDMTTAKAAFGKWHGVSVLLNLATIVCVAGAMALAGNLPAVPKPDAPPAPAV